MGGGGGHGSLSSGPIFVEQTALTVYLLMVSHDGYLPVIAVRGISATEIDQHGNDIHGPFLTVTVKIS